MSARHLIFLLALSFACSVPGRTQQLYVASGYAPITYLSPSIIGISEFSGGSVYMASAGIDDIQIPDARLGVVLNWTHTTTRYRHGEGSPSSGYVSDHFTRWSDLGVGLYPFHVRLAKHLRCDFGFELKYVLSENTYTNSTSYSMATQGQSQYSQSDADVKEKFYAGAIARISWPVQVRNQFFIAPQYQCYYGLSKEFDYPARTFRQNIGIAFIREMQ